MAAKRVRAGLTGLGDEKKCCGWAPIASASENESMRDWSLPEGPVSAKSLLGLASILGQCSGSAALSSRQASSPSSPSHCRTAAVLKSAFDALARMSRSEDHRKKRPAHLHFARQINAVHDAAG